MLVGVRVYAAVWPSSLLVHAGTVVLCFHGDMVTWHYADMVAPEGPFVVAILRCRLFTWGFRGRGRGTVRLGLGARLRC